MGGLGAQELTSVKISRAEVGIGEPFTLMLELGMIENSRQTVCNLVVDFGDGRTEQVRVASPQLTVSLQHSYTRPGPTVIQVGGKTRFQGLQSAIGCFGGTKSAAINVLPDDFAAKRAAALAEREAALKRAEQDRRVADAAAEDARKRRVEAETAAKRERDKSAADKRARDRTARAASQPKPTAVPPSTVPATVPANVPAVKAAPQVPQTKSAPPKAKSPLEL